MLPEKPSHANDPKQHQARKEETKRHYDFPFSLVYSKDFMSFLSLVFIIITKTAFGGKRKRRTIMELM